ncbi:hypothetical protein [Crassaminicella profunda]|uniref:hypothetical protein n=1 Tax=Crassaminicella profunda TaxID=1286698 RepID=UPI001CA75827|nr:hypothetical protein [Crassaminicella profunda]QZY56991.1 hypothetical protein K7H06_08760 [Crassaminicella profunda]
MEEKYDATYHFGNTTVHIIGPPPMTEEEIEKVLDEYHRAGWAIIQELREKGEDI